MTVYYSQNRSAPAFVGVGGHPIDTFSGSEEEWSLYSEGQRRNVLREMQRNRCYLCADTLSKTSAGINHGAPTWDHVVPKRLGGRNIWNLLLACRDCNQRKADRAPHPCEMLLLASVNWELRWRVADA